jgi:hypothetical protein
MNKALKKYAKQRYYDTPLAIRSFKHQVEKRILKLATHSTFGAHVSPYDNQFDEIIDSLTVRKFDFTLT